MEAKSKQRTARFSKDVKRHGKLKFPPLPGNVPRIVGKRNKGDEKFLSTNKLSILQRFFGA